MMICLPTFKLNCHTFLSSRYIFKPKNSVLIWNVIIFSLAKMHVNYNPPWNAFSVLVNLLMHFLYFMSYEIMLVCQKIPVEGCLLVWWCNWYLLSDHKGFWFSKDRPTPSENSLITMILYTPDTHYSLLFHFFSLPHLWSISFFSLSKLRVVSPLNEFRFQLSVADLIEFSVWPPTRESIYIYI